MRHSRSVERPRPAWRASSPRAAASPRRRRAAPKCPSGSRRPRKGRKAVQENAAKKVDIIKIWVDDRDGKFPKLTPPLYSAVIDEAHKQKLRVTAHIFSLEDAKGLLKAGIDSFAHGIRDRDMDDEAVALLKARPAFVLIPEHARPRCGRGLQLAEGADS